MAPLATRDGPELVIPVGLLVDSSLTLATDWSRIFGDYISQMLTRLHDLYTGQGTVCFSRSLSSISLIDRVGLVPDGFRVLCAPDNATDTIAVKGILWDTRCVAQRATS